MINWEAVGWGLVVLGLGLAFEHYFFRPPWPVLQGYKVAIAGVLAVLVSFLVYNDLSHTTVLPFWLPALFFTVGGILTIFMHWVDDKVTRYQLAVARNENRQNHPLAGSEDER